MSTTDVEYILGARIPLSDTSLSEPERTGSQITDEELRGRASGGAETSTPINCRFPIYSKRKSSMFWESSGKCQAPASTQVIFDIGEERAPDAQRAVGGMLCSRPETAIRRNSTDIG